MTQLRLLLVFFFCGCAQRTTPTEAPTPERWVKVRPVSAATALEGPARVLQSPAATSVVTPPFRATVVRVRVREGDVVDVGAPLVDVLMPELLDAAGRSEGARVRLAAWTEREQQLTALRAEGLARAVDVSEATARVAEAKADLQTARAVLLAAGVREVDVSGGPLTLKASLRGVVTRVTAIPGESREPAAGPLLSISGEAPVRVEARFPRAVPDGTWHFVDGLGQRSQLTLLSRAPAADARDGSFVAWFEPGAALMAGALGRAVFTVLDAPTHFRVAAAAVRREGAQAVLETRRGRVEVVVHGCDGETCTTSGDLRVDDDVLVERSP